MLTCDTQDALSSALVKLKEGRPYDYVMAKVEAVFIGWTESLSRLLADYEVLAVETEFQFPLFNPKSEAASKTFNEAGKIDGRLRHRRTGLFKVLEHKTTSEAITPDSNYWLNLVLDTQISKYVLAETHAGHSVDGVIYDVLRKPAQRPSQIALLDADGVKIVLDQSGNRVMTKDGKKFRQTADAELGYELQSREETPEEFHQRVLGVIRSAPTDYYVQREIPRSDSDLLEYMEDAWAQSQMILHFRRNNLWPRNPAACTAYGVCEFFQLCTGHASVDGIRYRPKAKAHSELTIVQGNRELLTNSRLRAFRKCARYHFLKYEEPIEPVYEDREALYFGTLFHEAAETYLGSFIQN